MSEILGADGLALNPKKPEYEVFNYTLRNGEPVKIQYIPGQGSSLAFIVMKDLAQRITQVNSEVIELKSKLQQ